VGSTWPRVRGDLLDEALRLIRQAWSGEPVNHAGHWRVDGIRFLPTPLRPDGIPVWAAEARRDQGLGDLPADYDIVVDKGVHPGPWEQAGATWWLRSFPWDTPLREVRRVVEAGPPR
jgi:Luciferase-like monooxygenase